MTPTTRPRIHRIALTLALFLTSATVLQLSAPARAAAAETTRVSVSSAGAEGNGNGYSTSTSADGRFVAFVSNASNLIGGDTNGLPDVFVRDRRAGSTRRVSVSSAGAQGNGNSFSPSISADGRFVAFYSSASNLVGGDTNGSYDVFVRDRQTGKTRRVSVSSAGSQGDGRSSAPSISANGRLVAFESLASNLVGGDTNGSSDVFVRDRRTDTTRRISVSSAAVQGDGASVDPSISPDGRLVAFGSLASNLVGGDTNGSSDVFVRDRQTGKTRQVSVSSAGTGGNGQSHAPSISFDGRFVAFYSDASNLVGADANGTFDVFVRDRQTGRTRRVSVSSTGVEGDGVSTSPSISADGRFVSFDSLASNLVGGDTNGAYDVFVRGPLR